MARKPKKQDTRACDFISEPEFDSNDIEIIDLDKVTLPGKAEVAYFLAKNELFYVDKGKFRNKYKAIELSADQLEKVVNLFRTEDELLQQLVDGESLPNERFFVAMSEEQKNKLASITGHKPEIIQKHQRMRAEADAKHVFGDEDFKNEFLRKFKAARGEETAEVLPRSPIVGKLFDPKPEEPQAMTLQELDKFEAEITALTNKL
jgi:hypothetical protein